MTATPLFEPGSTAELLEGWLLHAHKARDRHEAQARVYEGRRNLVGVPAIVLSAIVGTSVFATMQGSPNTLFAVGVGLIAVLAAILAALQTFLDYGGRAATHHGAAARYKGIIWEIEQAFSARHADVDATWLDHLRERLSALEEAAPVVSRKIWADTEAAYRSVEVRRDLVVEAGAAGAPAPDHVGG
jgi:hypothetical protein